MKETEISIENAAYAKMFMHGLKNSYDDVCGILIGKYSDVEKKKQRCVITDSIPLFHTHILSPFLNLAFTLVFMQDDATEEWKNCDVEVTRNNKDFLKMSLSNNEYLNLHDFDDHLNCINHDFMNSNLFNNV
ncbi:hypothetical protein PVIIG_03265 [Plasmodium vivax India VII]|uniref:Uncharacterized protein n=1 Tax=Plasmodium vivax India VII TaxID=1077284 RepID=A0A0J9SCJ9_PLAVI|nr:hypothetical protein PVIIG_03265 [Plasmodium vivax India VII]